MAKAGFNVTGIDISETAIEMARGLAAQQGLKIQFEIGDILKLEKLNQKFDLIYDSHFLHCIVFDEDRRLVLEGIRKSLATYGLFILDTMVMVDNFNPADGIETLRFDSDYILWHKTKPSADRGIVKLDDQHWCAQRRIYPSEKVIAEVRQAGLKIKSEQLDFQENGSPGMLRLILSL